MVDIELLRSILQAPGIPGREDAIRDLVAVELKPLVDELSIDPLGNLIGLKRGTGRGPRVMVAAHVDEIGFFVKYIDDRGFIRLQPVGGFDPRMLVAQRAIVHTRSGDQLLALVQPGAKPIHLQQPGDAKDLKIEDIFLDLGLPADEVKAAVEIGDWVTMQSTTEMLGKTVTSKTLDDRLCVYIMLEAMKRLGEHTADIYAVATTQEEVGLRGARGAAYSVDPEVGLALDVTIAGDIPGTPVETSVTTLHAGTAIKIFDSSHISNPKLVAHLRDLAEEKGIPHQLEILPRGGTDAGAMQQVTNGAAVATLSVPTRYVHSVNETASITDIEATIDLLVAFLEAAGSRSYGYELPADA
ncbi:MAG: M42 family metallopeptidase [Thermomicrobiales bacterium]